MTSHRTSRFGSCASDVACLSHQLPLIGALEPSNLLLRSTAMHINTPYHGCGVATRCGANFVYSFPAPVAEVDRTSILFPFYQL